MVREPVASATGLKCSNRSSASGPSEHCQKLSRDKPRVREGNWIPGKQTRYHHSAIIAGRLAPEESPGKRLDVSRYMDQGWQSGRYYFIGRK